jgi:hypothetical protein
VGKFIENDLVGHKRLPVEPTERREGPQRDEPRGLVYGLRVFVETM